jgi:hypothetical protein
VYSSLSVITPPAIEPVTVAQAAQHCRIDSPTEDPMLTTYITTARELVEQYLNRALITQTLQVVFAQRPAPPGLWPYVAAGPIFVLPLWFNWADVITHWLDLPRAPAQAVNSVSVGTWGQADMPLVLNQSYQTDLTMQPGRIRSWGFGVGNQDHLTVQYAAGYGDTADFVPARIKLAVLWLVAWLYEHRGDVGPDWPPGVIALLSDRLVTFG